VLRAAVPGLGDAAVPADAAGSPGMTVADPDRHIKDPQHADRGGWRRPQRLYLRA